MQDKTDGHKTEALEIGRTTPLKTAVWKVRRTLHKTIGRDVLDADKGSDRKRRARHVYRRIDEFVASFFPKLVKTTPKKMALKRVRDMIEELKYTVVDVDETKPWGAFYRLDNSQAERFTREFFPGLSMHEAKLGQSHVELSPKFLLVAPGHRLSWQYHHRRAERWRFLIKGGYFKSETDEPGEMIDAPAGTIVQFSQGERHRLCAYDDENYSLVAEIWQHTDAEKPSDEADIIRLGDDYGR